jgi:hypothetical protein
MDSILSWLLDNSGLAVLGTVGLLVLVGWPLVLGLGSIGRGRDDGQDGSNTLHRGEWD